MIGKSNSLRPHSVVDFEGLEDAPVRSTLPRTQHSKLGSSKQERTVESISRAPKPDPLASLGANDVQKIPKAIQRHSRHSFDIHGFNNGYRNSSEHLTIDIPDSALAFETAEGFYILKNKTSAKSKRNSERFLDRSVDISQTAETIQTVPTKSEIMEVFSRFRIDNFLNTPTDSRSESITTNPSTSTQLISLTRLNIAISTFTLLVAFVALVMVVLLYIPRSDESTPNPF